MRALPGEGLGEWWEQGAVEREPQGRAQRSPSPDLFGNDEVNALSGQDARYMSEREEHDTHRKNARAQLAIRRA